MSKDGKKRGEVKDEELRGVSAGGLKSPTGSKGPKKPEPKAKPTGTKLDFTTAPTQNPKK